VDDDEMRRALSSLGDADAVGHRVVHGGTALTAATVVTDEVLDRLRELVPLAPLHQPAALAGIAATATHRPGVPNVACFDTAFHATLPPSASTYAVPAAWRERWGIRRFGFHGLSHAWASRRAAELLGRPPAGLRLVTCHLGAGASLAAVAAGTSVDTTMGFTPLEGLVMATRSGSVDPGLLLWLLRQGGMAVDELADGLERRSGLEALAGTADMRDVVRRAGVGDAEAALALDVYAHRAAAAVAAMAAAMRGVDGIVFTGGVGENAPSVRAAIAERVAFLGVALDAAANAAATADSEITAPGAAVSALVVTAREDLQIAREVRRVMSGSDRDVPPPLSVP
jgi:acetate kinase